MLDLLDMLLPLAPQPPFDTCIKTWPVFGSREAITLDPLVLVETCLWEQLVCVLCDSHERTLVLGSIRVLVQAIAWHPQLAREVLELSVPHRLEGYTVESVGELVNRRLSELILSPDAELVSAALELLLNTVRLEAMANALDDELDTHAERTGKSKKRRKGRGADISEPQSGADSGTQTPVFGLRPLSRTISMMQSEESEPSMLPDGLAALVALVSQQWLSAACPPTPDDGKTEAPKHSTPQSQPTPDQHKPPTEPELREACTWVLLNYELSPALPGQQPNIVRMSDLYRRYMIAKQGQTVPRIGRALNHPEIVRVVVAVFPKAMLQNAGQRGQETLIAMHLKQKSQNIVPIPAVAIEAAEKPKPESVKKPANTCLWFECDYKFDSEQAALDHLRSHIPAADACRWGSCNRVPATGSASSWLPTHILTHGPFFKDQADKPAAGNKNSPDIRTLATKLHNEKSHMLAKVVPMFKTDNQQQVLSLVLQGVAVLEQLQKWADRRSGRRGEIDRKRVWRNGDLVVERIADLAGLSIHISPYVSKLLGQIKRSTVD
ncbi:hypothetical protein FBU59_003234 [Linderina macrospora]|uniref:Uncharacterized protein n=1 Tax=Linderina macrospora TaxID=4868 RepID=A0ACC1J924_9FUNG|nr:hypothetical protein FBU59_003234 [Linderina macrospora]